MHNKWVRILVGICLVSLILAIPQIQVYAQIVSFQSKKQTIFYNSPVKNATPELPQPTATLEHGTSTDNGPYPENADHFILNASNPGSQPEKTIQEIAKIKVEKEQTLINKEMVRNKVNTKNVTFEFFQNEGKSWLMIVRDDETGQFLIPVIIKNGNPAIQATLDLTNYLDKGQNDDFFDLISLKNPDHFPAAKQQLIADESGWNVVGGFVDGKLAYYYDALTNEIKLPDGKVVTEMAVDITGAIPADWKNWKGDVKDFKSYVTIGQISDLDKIIAYQKAHDTSSYPSQTACDLKYQFENDIHRPDMHALLYVKPEKPCSKADYPAHEVFAARLPFSNSQGSETLLFIIQKRYTPEGPLYIKFVTAQTSIESTYPKFQYFKTVYKKLSMGSLSMCPLVKYDSINAVETFMNDYTQMVLGLLGYTYDKAEVKDVLTQLLTHSQEGTQIPQELREQIEETLFFGSFCAKYY